MNRPRLVAATLLLLAAPLSAVDITVPATQAIPRLEAMRELERARGGGLATAATVSWQAGTHPLRTVADWFSEHRNVLRLAADVDPTTPVRLGDFSGTWWEGIDAVCQASGLDLLPPVLPPGWNQEQTNRGTPVWIAYGEPVLGRVPPHLRALSSSAKGIRIELGSPEFEGGDRGSAKGRIIVRLEPRLQGAARAAGIEGAQGRTLQIQHSTNDDSPMQGQSFMAEVSGGVTPAMRATLSVSTNWTAKGRLAVKDRILVELPGQRPTTIVRTDATTIEVIMPDVGQGWNWPNITGRIGNGKALSYSNSSGETRGRAYVMKVVFENLEEQQAIDLEVSSGIRLGSTTIDVPGFRRDRLPPGIAPLPEAGPGGSTPIAWTAGERSLDELRRLLDANGNRIAFVDGTDLTRRVAVGDFSGTWWQAVLDIAKRTGTTPRAVGQQWIFSDLANGSLFAPAGRFLLVVERTERQTRQTLAGREQTLTGTVRIEPEPRLRHLQWRIDALDVVGEDGNGNDDGDSSELQMHHGGRGSPMPTWPLRLAHLSASGPTTVPGLLRASASMLQSFNQLIPPKGSVTALYGDHALQLAILDPASRQWAVEQQGRMMSERTGSRSNITGLLISGPALAFLEGGISARSDATGRAVSTGQEQTLNASRVYDLASSASGALRVNGKLRIPVGSVVESFALTIPAE